MNFKIAAMATAMALPMTLEAATGPNNYINIDSDGVVAEIDRNGEAYAAAVAGNSNIIYTDLATQAELDSVRDYARKVDIEDHRVVSGVVVGDSIVMTSQDMDGGTQRTFTIDVSTLKNNRNKGNNNGQQGATGATGATGAVGATGATGAMGATGATGATGDAGTAGAVGQKGEDGAIGATGARGDTGYRGERGATGALGGLGVKGETGTTGATGATGANGARGEMGDKGETGDTGAKGDRGVSGSDGTDGRDGADGTTGARGSAGKDVDPNTVYDLRSGIAASLATTHAIRSDDGFRVGIGYYEDEHALSIGGRSGSKTFTLTFDSQDTISAGFGFDL